jgi:hypothetical protein
MSAVCSPVDLTIKYPRTELGELVRARHPKTLVLNADVKLGEIVLDLNFEKILSISRLIFSLKKAFQTTEIDSGNNLDASRVSMDDLVKPNGDQNEQFERLNSARILSTPPHGQTGELPRLSLISSVTDPNSGPIHPPDNVEKKRFLINLSLNFRLDRFAFMYAFPANGKIIKFSFMNLTMSANRAVFVVLIKNLILDLVSEGKTDSSKLVSEEIINLPCVA